MSESPERIWAGHMGEWTDEPMPPIGEVEYIRADLVEAAVKRAFEAAADRMRQAAATEDEMGHTINAALFDTAVSLIRALDPAQFVDGERSDE